MVQPFKKKHLISPWQEGKVKDTDEDGTVRVVPAQIYGSVAVHRVIRPIALQPEAKYVVVLIPCSMWISCAATEKDAKKIGEYLMEHHSVTIANKLFTEVARQLPFPVKHWLRRCIGRNAFCRQDEWDGGPSEGE